MIQVEPFNSSCGSNLRLFVEMITQNFCYDILLAKKVPRKSNIDTQEKIHRSYSVGAGISSTAASSSFAG